jgi:hypothetical protein
MTFADSKAGRDKQLAAAQFACSDGAAGETCLETLPQLDFFRGANVDTGWIKEKVGTEFDGEVLQNLKKAVYAIGQGGRRWFSGGGELSAREASVILDYAVLIELLLACRHDLAAYRDDLVDCREQLQMQISRYTEGQPERVTELVEILVGRIRRQLNIHG